MQMSADSRISRVAKSVSPDPLAAIIGAAVTIACVFHVPTRLGISGDDLGIVLGAFATIAASLRAMIRRKR